MYLPLIIVFGNGGSLKSNLSNKFKLVGPDNAFKENEEIESKARETLG